MAISKLNMSFKNKGESGAIPINGTNMTKVTRKIDEIIDDANLLENKEISEGDFNDITVDGFYIMQSTCSNSPKGTSITENDNYYLQHIGSGNNFGMQIAWHLWDENNYDQVCIRRKIAGTWEPWEKISGYEQDFAENGYQKLPSGLMFQWGTYETGDITASEFTTNVNFPISFPNSCFQVIATPHDPGNRATSLNNGIGTNNFTKTGFELRVKRGTVVDTFSLYVHWFAIGY